MKEKNLLIKKASYPNPFTLYALKGKNYNLYKKYLFKKKELEEQWEKVIRSSNFAGLEFETEDNRKIILTKSVRENVNYQLSYLYQDDAIMHQNYEKTNPDKDNKEEIGNFNELIDRLIYLTKKNDVEIKLLLDDTKTKEEKKEETILDLTEADIIDKDDKCIINPINIDFYSTIFDFFKEDKIIVTFNNIPQETTIEKFCKRNNIDVAEIELYDKNDKPNLRVSFGNEDIVKKVPLNETEEKHLSEELKKHKIKNKKRSKNKNNSKNQKGVEIV